MIAPTNRDSYVCGVKIPIRVARSDEGAFGSTVQVNGPIEPVCKQNRHHVERSAALCSAIIGAAVSGVAVLMELIPATRHGKLRCDRVLHAEPGGRENLVHSVSVLGKYAQLETADSRNASLQRNER